MSTVNITFALLGGIPLVVNKMRDSAVAVGRGDIALDCQEA